MDIILKNEVNIIKCLLLLLNVNVIHAEELPLNVRNICELSSERFPDNNHNVSEILHTYEECFKTLDRYSGLTKEFLLKQLSDKLDCFKEDLKQMYYAGNVRYSDVEQVENLKAEMQRGVKLNLEHVHSKKRKCDYGRTARSTVKHIIPLVLTGSLEEKKRACDAIFKLDKGGNFTRVDILTPKLDENKDPKELTVPLKQPTTYKIDSPEAENILPQYYKVIMKCLTLTTGHKIQVFKFNKKFYDWLTLAVLPHLKDEKCYPAFGGVLRIVETMRQKDFVPKNATANFIFYRQRDLDKNIQESRKKQDNTRRIFLFPYFPLIVITWLLFILILCCFLLWRSGRCFCACCGSGGDDDSSSSSTEVFYYPIEETPSISLDLDEISSVSLKTDPSTKTSSEVNRGANETQVYTMAYEHRHTLTGIPLKRQFSSENSFQSSHGLKSPGKRQKKMWLGYYK